MKMDEVNVGTRIPRMDLTDGERLAQINERGHPPRHKETRENADSVPDEDSASGRREPSSYCRAVSQSNKMRTEKGPADGARWKSSVTSKQRKTGDGEEREYVVGWRPRGGRSARDPVRKCRELASDKSLSGWKAE